MEFGGLFTQFELFSNYIKSGGSDSKESACNSGDGRDRAAWCSALHGVAKIQTRLGD